MPDPSWIFVLAMVTLALALVVAVFSVARTWRDLNKDLKASAPRRRLARERERTGNSEP